MVGSEGAIKYGPAIAMAALGAAVLACGISYGGVRVVKRAMGLTVGVFDLALRHAMSDAAVRRRQDDDKVALLMAEHDVYPVDQAKPPPEIAPPGGDDEKQD